MLKKSLLLTLTFLFLLICNVKSFKEGEKGLWCGERIIDESNYLPEVARNTLCNLIKDNRYIIVVKERLKDPRYPQPTDEEFVRDTEALFNERCRFFSNMCEDGVLISIYVNDMKIRIHAGEKAKEHLNISAREKIVHSVKNLLILKNFGGALESIVGSIKNYFEASESYSTTDTLSRKYWEATEGIKDRYERIKDSIRDSYYSTKEGIKDKYYDTKEELKRRFHESTSYPEESRENYGIGRTLFILFAFMVIGLMGLNLYNKAISSRILPGQKVDLHIYVKFLISLVHDIRKSNERSVLSNQCLLCAKTFEKLDPLAYKEGSADEILKFGCGHLYHRGCLHRLNRFKCLSCIESTNTTTYEKVTTDTRQYINEIDLMRFMDNLRLIYSQNELDDFYNNYPESRNTFENNFHINMINKYGCNDFSKRERPGVEYPSFDKDKAPGEGTFDQTRQTAATSGGNTASGEFR